MKKNGLEPFFFFSGADTALVVEGVFGFAVGVGVEVGVEIGVTTPRLGTSGTSTLSDMPARATFFALFFVTRLADFFAREVLFFADLPEEAFFTARFATFFAGLLADFLAAFFARFAATEFLLARYRRSGKVDQE